MDSQFERLSTDDLERRAVLGELLARLRKSETTADDHAMRYALELMADRYRLTRDEEILAALDAATIDGGFGNEVCGVYRRVIAEESARSRYRAIGAAPLLRCEGISFRKGEVEEILLAPP